MTPASLPEQLAERAEWEFPEITATGGNSYRVDPTKWGIVHVNQVSGTNYVELATPTRPNVRISVVQYIRSAGNLRIRAQSGGIWARSGVNGAAGPLTYLTVDTSDGVCIEFVSIYANVSGTKTLVWHGDVVQ